MKKLFLLSLFSLAVGISAFAAEPPADRKIEIKGEPQKIENVEIILGNNTPLVAYAAKELVRFLGEGSGLKPEIVGTPSGKGLSIVLGPSPLAEKEGLRPELLPSEGFRILRKGNTVFILGMDDPHQTPEQNFWLQMYRRSTLTGVYDFLERFAGVRFYFPGPHGTIVPKRNGFFLPPVIDILDRPDMELRTNYMQPSKGYGFAGEGNAKTFSLEMARIRSSEAPIPFGHGLAHLKLVERFGKSHPEYFAKLEDGSRYAGKKDGFDGQLCYLSGIRDIVFEDAKAYFTGKPATERGMSYWSSTSTRDRKYMSVMPQDYFYWCGCEKCSKIAPVGRGSIFTDIKAQNVVGECIWDFTAEIAERLTKAGVKGTITQMSYLPYNNIPERKLPPNIDVQAAVKGLGRPEARPDDEKLLKAWTEKLGHRITAWTYPGKHCSKAEMKGIPAMMHHDFADYFKHFAKYLNGAFNESETDYDLFNYLNFYMFSRIAWNTSADADALLAEHYKLMFGNAAEPMRQVYDECENIWCKKILGRTVDTSLGPVPKLPSIFEVWTNIYNEEKLDWFNARFDQAEKMVSGPELARVKFIRKEMFGPLMEEAEKFASLRKLTDNWSVNVPGRIALRPFDEMPMPFPISVSFEKTASDLVIRFDASDPESAKLPAKCTENSTQKLFSDTVAEVFLNPSGDRKHYFQLAANLNGKLFTAAWVLNEKERKLWKTGTTVSAERKETCWTVTFHIPLKDLGNLKNGMPANFCVERAMKGNLGDYFHWSPGAGGTSFHETVRWGVLNLTPVKDDNMLFDSDFTKLKPGDWNSTGTSAAWGDWGIWRSGGTNNGQKVEAVSDYFLTGGKSLHLVNNNGKVLSAVQNCTFKPNTKYVLSWSAKTRLSGTGGLAAQILFGDPAGTSLIRPSPMISGNNNWINACVEFTTPAEAGMGEKDPHIAIGIFHADGEAWIDNVRLIEVK